MRKQGFVRTIAVLLLALFLAACVPTVSPAPSETPVGLSTPRPPTSVPASPSVLPTIFVTSPAPTWSPPVPTREKPVVSQSPRPPTSVPAPPSMIPASACMPKPGLAPIADPPDARQIFERMYGDGALSITDEEVLIRAPVQGLTTTVRLNLLAPYREGTTDKILVLTSGAFSNAHVAGATIDGAILVKSAGGWTMDTIRHDIVELGSFGYIPPGELVQIGPDKYGALLRSGWAGQGYESTRVTIIAQVEACLIVTFDLRRTDEKQAAVGLEKSWGYTATLEFIDSNTDFYDIRLTQQGTDREGKEFLAVKNYAFLGTGYVLVENDH